MPQLVLMRHGQSEWNKANRFTGWHDVDLTEEGVIEARRAGRAMREEDLGFDVCYTSYLKRAIKTLWFALEELDLMWLPVTKDWRLNERHYGALQGLNKQETRDKHGDDQVKIWRRSYDTPPPPLGDDDERHPKFDARYAALPASALPATESLKLTIERVMPCWEELIAPDLRAGRRVLISAHGNSLRGLVKYLENISDEDIVEREIATGVPIVYELDESLQPQRIKSLDGN